MLQYTELLSPYSAEDLSKASGAEVELLDTKRSARKDGNCCSFSWLLGSAVEVGSALMRRERSIRRRREHTGGVFEDERSGRASYTKSYSVRRSAALNI